MLRTLRSLPALMLLDLDGAAAAAKPPRASCRAWLFLVFAALFLNALPAAGQGSLRPEPRFTAGVRCRLAEVARDSALAPWQRDFMLEVAHHGVGGRVPQLLPATPGVTLPSSGIAADDGTWSALTPAGTLPSGRARHAAIYDPVRDRMVVFGGFDGSGYNNDVWALSLAGSPAWSQLAPEGSPPSARSGHTAIYDPVRDRMVVFGGGLSSPPFLNDVWALSLAGSPAWIALAPTGSPPSARSMHTAIYDPVRDRMLVFAGLDGGYPNDVWALSLAGSPAWSALAPTGSPPSGRIGHTAIYDPARERMVVFGGSDGSLPLNEAWALSLAGSPAWSALAPTGSPPPRRFGHTAIYDPVRDRMVVFGGYSASPRNDAWALSLAGNPAWSGLAPAASPPSARYRHTAIYDPLRGRMVVFAGLDASYANDVWALTWGTPVSVPGDANAHRRRLEFYPPRPNPSRGETVMDFELGEPAWIVLDVLDVHGRRVKRIADGLFPAGRQASTWRGDDDRGHALESGVYFIRIQGGGFQATRRTVRVR